MNGLIYNNFHSLSPGAALEAGKGGNVLEN